MTDRKHPRYAIELDVVIVTGGTELSGRTGNLSRGGFCMMSDRPLELGTHCVVKLALVFSDNQFSEQLELEASVAWCTLVRAGHQIGISFGKTGVQDAGYLDLFLRFLAEGEEEEGEEAAAHSTDNE